MFYLGLAHAIVVNKRVVAVPQDEREHDVHDATGGSADGSGFHCPGARLPQVVSNTRSWQRAPPTDGRGS